MRTLTELLLATGISFVVVAYAAWEVGVRDPLLLTVLTLVLGWLLGRAVMVVVRKIAPAKEPAAGK